MTAMTATKEQTNMFDHLSLGISDLERSRAFYDASLAALGLKRLSDGEDSLGYGDTSVGLWLLLCARPVPAEAGSGLHLCFRATSRAAVDRFHAAALARGGQDNGAPGLRPDYGPDYYAAFVIDPDGYRLEAYCSAHA